LIVLGTVFYTYNECGLGENIAGTINLTSPGEAKK
jgi:hypothetical protein